MRGESLKLPIRRLSIKLLVVFFWWQMHIRRGDCNIFFWFGWESRETKKGGRVLGFVGQRERFLWQVEQAAFNQFFLLVSFVEVHLIHGMHANS